MKLLSVLALAASSLSPVAAISISAAAAGDYEHARVVPSALPAESIAALHGQAGIARLLRTKLFGDTDNRKHGETAVQPDDLRRILRAIGDRRDKRHLSETTTLRSTIITGNTDPHTDVKINDGVELDEDEDVMIVFLNDNEDAHFQVGKDKIQVEAGTAVIFKGNKVVHNTIVRSGEVRLLGPISSRDLQDVGEETLVPCTNPEGDTCGESDEDCVFVIKSTPGNNKNNEPVSESCTLQCVRLNEDNNDKPNGASKPKGKFELLRAADCQIDGVPVGDCTNYEEYNAGSQLDVCL